MKVIGVILKVLIGLVPTTHLVKCRVSELVTLIPCQAALKGPEVAPVLAEGGVTRNAVDCVISLAGHHLAHILHIKRWNQQRHPP